MRLYYILLKWDQGQTPFLPIEVQTRLPETTINEMLSGWNRFLDIRDPQKLPEVCHVP